MKYTEGSDDANILCELIIHKGYENQRRILKKEALDSIKSSKLPYNKIELLLKMVKPLWERKECGCSLEHVGWNHISEGEFIELYPGCAITKELLDEEWFCDFRINDIKNIKSCPCEG